MFTVIDLDNCISNDTWRLKHINWWEEDLTKRYHNYQCLSGFDTAHNLEHAAGRIIVLTSRSIDYQAVTQEWLRRLDLNPAILIMRAKGDFRESVDFKVSQMQLVFKETDIKKQDILVAYDDRLDIVEAYRKMGLNAEQLYIDAPEKQELIKKRGFNATQTREQFRASNQ